MSKIEDEKRQAEIDQDFIARVIHDALEAIPACQRLYPDLYALDVSKAVRGAVEARLDPINRKCSTCKRTEGQKCVMMAGDEMQTGYHAMRYPQYKEADIQRVIPQKV